jgi:hypothetical protein
MTLALGLLPSDFSRGAAGRAKGHPPTLVPTLPHRRGGCSGAIRSAIGHRCGTFGVTMEGMAYCERCEMERAYCEHGLAESHQAASSSAVALADLREGDGALSRMPAQRR